VPFGDPVQLPDRVGRGGTLTGREQGLDLGGKQPGPQQLPPALTERAGDGRRRGGGIAFRQSDQGHARLWIQSPRAGLAVRSLGCPQLASEAEHLALLVLRGCGRQRVELGDWWIAGAFGRLQRLVPPSMSLVERCLVCQRPTAEGHHALLLATPRGQRLGPLIAAAELEGLNAGIKGASERKTGHGSREVTADRERHGLIQRRHPFGHSVGPHHGAPLNGQCQGKKVRVTEPTAEANRLCRRARGAIHVAPYSELLVRDRDQ
jgi:hypothetical protein